MELSGIWKPGSIHEIVRIYRVRIHYKGVSHMPTNKTRPTTASVRRFISSIEDPLKKKDCQVLLSIMRGFTSERPVMWGESIIGLGICPYRYASGREGIRFRAGFSPRKNALTLYLMLDLGKQTGNLSKLGKHKTGKSCLYIKKLSDVDLNVLEEMIGESFRQDQDSASCG